MARARIGSGGDVEGEVFWAASTYPSEDYKIDEKDDTSRPLNKIHSSSRSFREQMTQIAHYSYLRADSRTWASSLRVLEIECTDDDLAGSALSERSMAQAPSFPKWSLHLQDKKDTSLLPYVAVSYCWDRSGVSWSNKRNAHQASIFQNKKVRHLTSSDVVYRASVFAKYHECGNIWMDQYCIDQDDPEDKQEGIQAMDIVYQSSKYPVAILESYIDSQSQIDALALLFTGEMDDTSCLEELEAALDLLLDDPWFTRAWTLQEAVASGLTMYILIGCEPSLTKPKEFSYIPGEIETNIWDLQTAMVAARNWIEEVLADDILEDTSLAIRISNYADELLNMLPNILPAVSAWSDQRPRDPSADRQICNAAEAINILQDRKNSVFSDRLGIIGNLCDYEVRLPSIVLDQTMPFSFSTCVHTLAILNGDVSLLGRYSDPYSRSYLARDGRNVLGFTSDPFDSPDVNFGFSWGPNPRGALRNIEHYDTHDEPLKLEPATLSVCGLKVKGILWLIQSQIDLGQLQASFRERWQAELQAQAENPEIDIREVITRSEPLATDFASALTQTLYNRQYYALTLTLWNYFLPRQDDSRTSHPLYAFDEVFGSNRSCQGVESIKTSLNVPDLATFDVPETKSSILRSMLDEVCSKGCLLFGGLQSDRSVEPRVYFESCNMGDFVFTPRTALGDKICTESIYKGQAVSWKVLSTDQVDGDSCVLHCLGRRRGIYRMDDLDVPEYCLE